MALYSLQVERHSLGGLIKNSEIYLEIASFIDENDFHHPVHHTIFCCIRDLVLRGQKVDKVILAQKVKDLGISFSEQDIDIFEYVDTLSYTQINAEGTIEAFKNLKTFRVRRDLDQTANKIKEFVNKCGDKHTNEIITEVDAIYNKRILTYDSVNEPEDIFADMVELIEDRGNNPVEDIGILTPYKQFNEMWGGLRGGNLYAFVARPENGKSTLLADMGFNSSRLTDFKIPALFLDTEMFSVDMKFRIASSLTGIPMWYLETGNWRKVPEYVKILREMAPIIRKFKFHHYSVGNRDVDQVCSLIRRWYYSKVGRGNKSLIIYDYIKLTGEKLAGNWAEHQAIGEKADKLKKIGEEINAPILAAVQANRSAENSNRNSKDVVDDASVISQSDRIQWFASFTALWRRKTIDEISEHGVEFGTHKMLKLKTRFQGKMAAGHHDLVRVTDSDGSVAYKSNFLNFQVENFAVKELGSLKDMIQKGKDISINTDSGDEAVL